MQPDSLPSRSDVDGMDRARVERIERLALAVAGEDDWPDGTSALTQAKYRDAAERVLAVIATDYKEKS